MKIFSSKVPFLRALLIKTKGVGNMPKKETGVPNLDKYLGERQRTLCNYEQGARMYGVPYYTFVNLCKEAGASFKVKRTAIYNMILFNRLNRKVV